jgi:hypothetical protein
MQGSMRGWLRRRVGTSNIRHRNCKRDIDKVGAIPNSAPPWSRELEDWTWVRDEERTGSAASLLSSRWPTWSASAPLKGRLHMAAVCRQHGRITSSGITSWRKAKHLCFFTCLPANQPQRPTPTVRPPLLQQARRDARGDCSAERTCPESSLGWAMARHETPRLTAKRIRLGCSRQ